MFYQNLFGSRAGCLRLLCAAGSGLLVVIILVIFKQSFNERHFQTNVLDASRLDNKVNDNNWLLFSSSGSNFKEEDLSEEEQSSAASQPEAVGDEAQDAGSKFKLSKSLNNNSKNGKSFNGSHHLASAADQQHFPIVGQPSSPADNDNDHAHVGDDDDDGIVKKNSLNNFKSEEIRKNGSSQGVSLLRNRRMLTIERRPILNEFSFPANLVQGMRFVLMCQVLDGDRPIQIKWFKENQELSANNNNNNNQDQSYSTNKEDQQQQQQQLQQVELLGGGGQDELGASLLFRHVQPQHSGNYTCIATNHFGSSSYSSIMSVKVPPKWKVEPQDQESIMGEQITIDCQASGNPNPFIRWKFASSSLSMLADPLLAQENNHLPSNNLRIQQHQQTAVNILDSRLLLGNIINSPLVIGGSFLPSHQNNNQQQTVSGNNFKLINSNHHVQSLENGSLSIRQAGKDHEGYYMCEADNGIEPNLVKVIKLIVHLQAQFSDDLQLTIIPSSQAIPLSVNQANDTNLNSKLSSILPVSIGQAPTPTQQLNGVGQLQHQNQLIKTVKLAQNTSQVKLLCQPFGDLPVSVDWLKDGQLIYTHSMGLLSGDHLSMSSSNGGGNLASDRLSDSSSVSPNRNLNGELSTRYHVNTRRSSLRPMIGLDSELVIINLRRSDAGQFTCLARNAYGASERKLKLIVQEPPEPPEVVDVAHIGSRSISLRWLASSNDGNSPISKYIVEFWRHSTNQENDNLIIAQPGQSEKIIPFKSPESQQQLVVVGGLNGVAGSVGGGQQGGQQQQQQQQIQHTVHELEPLTRYSIRVVAVNAIGRSRPSVALSLRTEEEVPSVVPSPVEALVISSRSIKLHWTITYSPEHEIIDGFFVGYRSFDASNAAGSLADLQQGNNRAATSHSSEQQQATFTYKTIRLTNNNINTKMPRTQLALLDNQQQQQQQQQQPILEPTDLSSTAFISPISSLTKNVGPNSGLPNQAFLVTGSGSNQPSSVVVSNFEYVIGGLERNTEYSILIQCFNKKGAGPTSDSVVFKTFVNDPPEKLTLTAEEVTESSLKVGWRFLNNNRFPTLDTTIHPASNKIQDDPVDGFMLTFTKLSNRLLKFKQHNSDINGNNKSLPVLGEVAAHVSNSAQPSSSIFMDQWQAIQLAPQQKSHQLKNLDCGTSYAMKIWAFNKVGKGEPSDLLTVSTRGKSPVPPDKRSFISINSTHVRLHLSAWYDGGCEIEKFIIQYRVRGQQEWILVSNNIFKEQVSVVIRDLTPATSYELLVSAHNQVGPTEVRFRFTTLDADGKQVLFSHHRSFLNHFTSYTGASAKDSFQDGDEGDQDYYIDGVGRDQLWLDSSAMLLARHLLSGSSGSLLFLTSLSLLCLMMFVFYKRYVNNISLSSSSINDSLHPSSGGSSSGSSNKSNMSTNNNCADGPLSSGLMTSGALFGGDLQSQRRLSLEANTTVLDNLEPIPMSLANESFTDSPRVVNQNNENRQHYAGDCNVHYKTLCGTDFNRSPVGCNHQQQTIYNANNGNNDYSLLPIGPNANYASLGATQRQTSLDLPGPQTTGSNVANISENEHRCLMQMLLLAQPTNQPLTDGTQATSSSSYVTALTTMARNKNGGLIDNSKQSCLNGFGGNAATFRRQQHFSTFQPGYQELSAENNGNQTGKQFFKNSIILTERTFGAQDINYHPTPVTTNFTMANPQQSHFIESNSNLNNGDPYQILPMILDQVNQENLTLDCVATSSSGVESTISDDQSSYNQTEDNFGTERGYIRGDIKKQQSNDLIIKVNKNNINNDDESCCDSEGKKSSQYDVPFDRNIYKKQLGIKKRS